MGEASLPVRQGGRGVSHWLTGLSAQRNQMRGDGGMGGGWGAIASIGIDTARAWRRGMPGQTQPTQTHALGAALGSAFATASDDAWACARQGYAAESRE